MPKTNNQGDRNNAEVKVGTVRSKRLKLLMWKEIMIFTVKVLCLSIYQSVKSVRIQSFFVAHFFPHSNWIYAVKIYWVNLRIQSESGKMQTKKNSIFGHFLRTICFINNIQVSLERKVKISSKLNMCRWPSCAALL